MTTPAINAKLTIRKFHGVVNVGGKQFLRDYWVGMCLPEHRDPDDFTMVEVTHRYVTRRALTEALSNETALLRQIK